MTETNFFAPDYMKGFKCKTGECRNSCCAGWPVSLGMSEYFSLLGLSCEPELRALLDRATYTPDRPTEEEYARLRHGFDGNCVLRCPDGLCRLHRDLGESVLPDVCRLYPRGIRKTDGLPECSCSNSCEAVPELFWDRKEPLSFGAVPLSLTPPRDLPLLKETELRRRAAAILGDTSLSAAERFGQVAALTGAKNVCPDDPELLSEIFTKLSGLNDALSLEAGEVIEDFGKVSDKKAEFEKRELRFAELFGDKESYFALVCANHAFFSGFPSCAKNHDAALISLSLAYRMNHFLCVIAAGETDFGPTDLTAALFRLIEHTDFYSYAPGLAGGGKKEARIKK